MQDHVRIGILAGRALTANIIERRLIGHFPSSITTVDLDPHRFQNVLRTRRYDLAIVDEDALTRAPKKYLPDLAREFGHRSFLLLLNDSPEAALPIPEPSWSIMIKEPGFENRVPLEMKRMLRRKVVAVPGRRAAEILEIAGDTVPLLVSRLEDDLNNPLQTICATVELLRRRGEHLDAFTLSRLAIIEESAARMQQSILSLSLSVRQSE